MNFFQSFFKRNNTSRILSLSCRILSTVIIICVNPWSSIAGAATVVEYDPIDLEQFSFEAIDDQTLGGPELDSLVKTQERFKGLLLNTRNSKAYDLVVLGLDSLQKGDFNQGRDFLKQAWEQDSNLYPAGVIIIINYLQNKKYTEAIELIDILAQQLPKYGFVYDLKGIAYSGLGDKSKSTEFFLKALEINPGDLNALNNLAVLSLSEKDIKQARNFYLQALTYNPNHPALLLKLAKLESGAGDFQKTIFYLKSAADNHSELLWPHVLLARAYFFYNKPKDAIRAAEHALIQFPDNVSLQEIIGFSWVKLGVPEKAIDILTKLYPKSESTLYSLALAHEQLKSYQPALKYAETLLDISPEYIPAQFLKARLLVRLGKLDEAANILGNLVDKFPNNQLITELKGDIALGNNLPNEAVDLFEKALKERENNYLVIRLALAQAQAGQKEEGFSTFSNWLDRYPEDILTRTALAELQIAYEMFDEARQNFTKIVQQEPGIASAQNNLAWLFAKEGDLDKALVHAKLAIELAPNKPQVIDTYGVILLRKGHAKKAVSLLLKASKLSPGDKSISFHLAQALVESKDTNKAKVILNDLLNMSNSEQFLERKQAKKLLITLEKE